MLKKYSYSQRVKNVLRRATYFLGGQLPEFALIYCPQLLEPVRSLHLYRRHYRGGAFPWRLLFEQHTCQPSPKLRFFRQFPSVLCRLPRANTLTDSLDKTGTPEPVPDTWWLLFVARGNFLPLVLQMLCAGSHSTHIYIHTTNTKPLEYTMCSM